MHKLQFINNLTLWVKMHQRQFTLITEINIIPMGVGAVKYTSKP